jgi:probable F420-dependent oxidoreductase
VNDVPLTFGVRHDFRQPLPHRQPYAEYYEECIQEVKLAETLGFDAVWVTEHHFWDDGYLPSSFGMLAALARETKRMTLGTSVVLLPLYHPLRVAEDATLVDLVSHGRLILGLGLGYVLQEFQVLGADRTKRGELMDEGIAIIKQAWEQGRVDFEGRHWKFRNVAFEPRPIQRPRPPIYLGGSSPVAFRRVAREADGYLDPGGATKLAEVSQRYAAVRDALASRGREPAKFPFVLGPSVHLDDDSARAWGIAAPAIAYQSNQYAQWGTDPDKPRPAEITPASLSQDDFLVGTPELVLEKLQRLYDAVPYTQVCVWGRLPGITHEQACSSLDLFGQRVMPQLKAYVEGRNRSA